MKYQFIPHTADLKIKAHGKKIEEAFENSAIGFTKFISKSRIKKNIEKNILITGIDLKNLLYNFIEEFIVLFDSEYFLISKIEKIKIRKSENGFELESKIWGDKNSDYEIASSVKAITYDEMSIEKKKNYFEIIFTLDI